ncbi:MAG: polyprenyl synthetase family protein [Candidatus Hatepunaea meridiana]|nr:polyprenyl synthetase family protein [Candidatus Hatepunaea meridiana]
MLNGKLNSNNGVLARFQEPIIDDLKRFRKQYSLTLQTEFKVINRVVAYLSRTHGKGLRPTLTLLCARLGDESVNDNAIRAAVIVELLHEATLVHDDVVDESDQRRGFPSLPARFKNKIAVLFGDFMLASVLRETLSARDLQWLDILSDTSRRMAKGELVQAVRAKRLDMDKDDYLKMIGDKTAALFNASCQLGGLTAGLPEGSVTALGEYGEKLGIAFQIRDDMLDLFGDGRGLGKPVGGDLKEKKLTLPLLAALSRVGKREASRIKARIRRGIKRKEIKNIIEFVRSNNGDNYATEYMNSVAKQAVQALDTIPDSLIRKLLVDLAEFAVIRGK